MQPCFYASVELFLNGHYLIKGVGPTAGYFPDPLFARGVDVVGGRAVKNGDIVMAFKKFKGSVCYSQN